MHRNDGRDCKLFSLVFGFVPKCFSDKGTEKGCILSSKMATAQIFSTNRVK